MSCGFQIVDPVVGAVRLIVDGESLEVDTILGGDWQQKVRLVAVGLSPAIYRIVWSYNWNLNSTSKNFEARIQLDDSTVVMSHVEEPKDSNGAFASTGSGQSLPASGVLTRSLSGSVDIDLDWRSPGAPKGEASIWNARLELWKIA